MTDAELIARQAKLIAELTDALDEHQARMRNAVRYIIGIGGPLNDNTLHYTSEQLRVFQLLVNELEEP